MATEFIYDTPLWKVRRLGDGWYQGETPLWETPTSRTKDFQEARRWIETQVERYLDNARAIASRARTDRTEGADATCPDGGRCWHECDRHCWRVHNVGPLSDYGTDWPLDVDDVPRRPNAGSNRGVLSSVQLDQIADLLDAGEEAFRALERITGRPAPMSGRSEVQDTLRAMATGTSADRVERITEASGTTFYQLQATGVELGAVHRLLETQIGVLEAWAAMRHTTEEEARALRHDAQLIRSFVKRNYEER